MARLINLSQYSVTIANGASLSSAIAIGADMMVGIFMPPAWTAAGLTFQASPDGGTTWGEVVDTAGVAIGYTVAAGTFTQVPQGNWCGINMLKIRSGTLALPVNQGADRVFTLMGRPPNW